MNILKSTCCDSNECPDNACAECDCVDFGCATIIGQDPQLNCDAVCLNFDEDLQEFIYELTCVESEHDGQYTQSMIERPTHNCCPKFQTHRMSVNYEYYVYDSFMGGHSLDSSGTAEFQEDLICSYTPWNSSFIFYKDPARSWVIATSDPTTGDITIWDMVADGNYTVEAMPIDETNYYFIS